MSAGGTDSGNANKTLTAIIYGLYAGSFLTGGVTGIAAIIMNYIKKEDVAGTWLESHFRWQIRSFWYGLLWACIGWILLLVIIGYPILMADSIWLIYRIVKGWLRLNDNKPMYSLS